MLTFECLTFWMGFWLPAKAEPGVTSDCWAPFKHFTLKSFVLHEHNIKINDNWMQCDNKIPAGKARNWKKEKETVKT